MKTHKRTHKIAAFLVALTVTATLSWADPNITHSETIQQLNAAVAGITETQMSEANAVTPAQKAAFLLHSVGVGGEWIEVEGGGYRFPTIAVTRPGGPATSYHTWLLHWDNQSGFYYLENQL